MKKPKNKHGKQFSKLIIEIRSLIKKYAHHHTTTAFLLAPGLSSVLSGSISNDFKTFEEIFTDETKKLQNKYKKININNMYWQVRKEDIQNFATNNYSIDPRDTSYIDEDGKKIIRL